MSKRVKQNKIYILTFSGSVLCCSGNLKCVYQALMYFAPITSLSDIPSYSIFVRRFHTQNMTKIQTDWNDPFFINKLTVESKFNRSLTLGKV